MQMVRAKVTHTQPGTQIYRVEDETFPYEGKLYKHVEAVKQPRGEERPEDGEQKSKEK